MQTKRIAHRPIVVETDIVHESPLEEKIGGYKPFMARGEAWPQTSEGTYMQFMG